ncbi:MAG TPA: hypothetical protein VGO16_03995 [Pseudonocardiaceae bacterium]|nr:hypothetical protein [Pseudonocardiaceae bacterium]
MTTRILPGRAGTARLRRMLTAISAALLLAGVVTGCGGGPTPTAGLSPPSSPAPESNPAGDIPDNQAYVPYTSPQGWYTVSVPEGWSRAVRGPAVVFTDKLNTVTLETRPQPAAPDVASARAQELPALQASVPGYQPGQVTMVTRAAGPAVLITYGAPSPPDPVTGKTTTDAVERYEFWKAGQELILTLSGPQGADNADPWHRITDSVRWQ